ncbi:class I SAM-dependent methyltransferase [Alloscardovia criceti]|uniref:class I SAM-dependent methyltransferase n=1 Tax=Alloscardovia criceti TaxID=356828 RepID=UPI000477FC96|nr:class I SAM-dependent methyltransferase [Alloscardovia criceti]
MENYQEFNSTTIDAWIEDGWEWGVPIDHDTYVAAQQGQWSMVLTPKKPVPSHWFPELAGKKVLGLAAGGGQQMPIFAAVGAQCTVLDYSAKQLESERLVAQREGYDIDIVHADMTKRLPFEDESFDFIFHPVSNCYIEKVEPLYAEAYRVLKKGGVLLAGFDMEIMYLLDDDEKTVRWKMPFNPLSNPEAMAYMQAGDYGVQFSHTITEQIGGQLKAGFTLTDLYEDTPGYGHLEEMNVNGFMATRAVKA